MSCRLLEVFHVVCNYCIGSAIDGNIQYHIVVLVL